MFDAHIDIMIESSGCRMQDDSDSVQTVYIMFHVHTDINIKSGFAYSVQQWGWHAFISALIPGSCSAWTQYN